MTPRLKTTEQFIEDAKTVHGNTYDYRNSVYTGARQSIEINCPKHGPFIQQASSHLGGAGCPKCWEARKGLSRRRNSLEDFLAKAKEIHGDKYDYSKTELKMITARVEIICPTHGRFVQVASDHLRGRGCMKCSADKNKKGALDEMIGQTFGRLLVNNIEMRGDTKHPIAICQCICGKEYMGRAYHVRDLRVRSCGCLNNEKRIERTIKDLTGMRFGRWTVLERAETRTTRTGQKKAIWKCQCDCGKTDYVMATSLNNGNSTSCGCYRTELVKQLFTEDLVGQKFNRLLVISRGNSARQWGDNSRVTWNCQCDCGEVVTDIPAHTLKSGGTKSCGCLKLEATIKANTKPVPIGYRSGLLTVVRELDRSERVTLIKRYHRMNCYHCKCDCGNTKDLPSFLLRGDAAQLSCGCLSAGRDSYSRFVDDVEHGATKCYLYIAETIFDNCIKIGISRNPENRSRDSQGVYCGWRLLAPMRRDICWLIEQLLLRDTKPLFRRPTAMKEAWAGQFELRKDELPMSWYIAKIKAYQREINSKGFRVMNKENLIGI
jgi:hypothetical protein